MTVYTPLKSFGLLLLALLCLTAISAPALAQPGGGPGGGGGGSGDPPRTTPGLAPAILAGMAAAGYVGKKFFKK